MFCLRNVNIFINKIQERILTLITNDKTTTFKHLLQANNEVTTHQRNLQVLMMEVLKIIIDFAPTIIQEFFLFRENTHNTGNFQIKSIESAVKYGTPVLQANVPEKYESEASLHTFKTKIETWKCETSSICKIAFQPISSQCCIDIPPENKKKARMSQNELKNKDRASKEFFLFFKDFFDKFIGLFIYLFIYLLSFTSLNIEKKLFLS